MAKRKRRRRGKPATQLLLRNELRELMAHFRRDELDEEEMLAGLRRLLDKGGEFVVRQLVRTLTAPDPEQRNLGSWALMNLRDQRSIPHLRELTHDRAQDRAVRLMAWNILVELGEADLDTGPPADIRPDDMLAALDEQTDLVIGAVRQLESSDEIEAVIGSTFGNLDEETLLMLIERLEARGDAGAADLLMVLSAVSGSKVGRKAARRALQKLKLHGIQPQLKPAAQLGSDRFYKGYVGLMREQGEVPLILGWQRPDGKIQALVFLIDYWGRGLKEFFPTHNLTKREFRRDLVGRQEKNIPMVEVSLAEGKRLVEEALLYNDWFDEPLPDQFNEYRFLVESKVLEARVQLPPQRRSFINSETTPSDLVHYFLEMPDFGLRYELLAASHPLRREKSWREYVEEQLAWADQAQPRTVSVDVLVADQEGDQATVTARWVQDVIIGGQPTRQDDLLRFDFVHEEDGWRIATYGPVSSTQAAPTTDELLRLGKELMEKAQALADQEEYETAEAYAGLALSRCDQAITLSPDCRPAYEQARETAEALRDFDRAIAYCDQMAERFPDKADIYLEKAGLCIRSIEHEYETPPPGFESQRERQAVEALEASISHQPTPFALLLLGESLEQWGQKSEALAHYTRARELFPDDLGVLNKWGMIYGNRGDFRQALPLFEEVYRRDPTFQHVCYNLGLTCSNLDDLDKAVTFYEEQLRYDPDHADTYNNLANIYARRGEHRRAIPIYRKAIKLKPDDVLFHNNLAVAYHHTGQRRQSTVEFRRALKLDTDHPVLLSALAALRPDLLPRSRQRR
ncbi:MAG: tetratricopeptide repeat protein [Anaerolineae bacterium]